MRINAAQLRIMHALQHITVFVCVCRHLAAAEGRIFHSDTRVAELMSEVSGLQDQLSGALGQLSSLQGEHTAMREEYQALEEDMQALVRENQVSGRSCEISMETSVCCLREVLARKALLLAPWQYLELVVLHSFNRSCTMLWGSLCCLYVVLPSLPADVQQSCVSLQVVSSEHASLGVAHEGLEAATAQLRQQLHNTEQQLRIRDVEASDIRSAYEGLATEHRRLQSTIMQVQHNPCLVVCTHL